MSRSSVVYGPFSLVWGFGAVLLTAILYQYRTRSDSFIFLFGTVLGGAYEYVCSVFTELVFGTVFWDYSHLPFNLGGRINLLFCFFWGIAAVLWLKLAYPALVPAHRAAPHAAGKLLTWGMIVFMLLNAGISSLAMTGTPQRSGPASPPKPHWSSGWTNASPTSGWSASTPTPFWWTESAVKAQREPPQAGGQKAG